MTRAELRDQLWGVLQAQFAEVGMANADSSGNLKETLDLTLLALGVAFGDVATGAVATGDEGRALLLGMYYGLERVYWAALQRVDVSTSVGSPSVSRSESGSQYVRALETALERARVNAAPFLPEEAAASWGSGRISLDFLQPGCGVIAEAAL